MIKQKSTLVNEEVINATSTLKDLNLLLSNLHISYQTLRNFHWNIKGRQFFVLHPLFEEWYNDVQAEIDEVAERILVFGIHPKSTLLEYVKRATISEPRFIVTSDIQMFNKLKEDIDILIENHRTILESSTENEDEGTTDLIAGHLRAWEKKAWQVKAWLNN